MNIKKTLVALTILAHMAPATIWAQEKPKYNPLISAIEDVADATHNCSSSTLGYLAGTAGTLALLPLGYWLSDEEFQKDFNNVAEGKENNFENQIGRGVRQLTNKVSSTAAQHTDVTGLNQNEALAIKIYNTVGYPKAIELMPNPKKRVVGICLATVVAAAGVGTGLATMLRSLKESSIIRSKMRAFKACLTTSPNDALHDALEVARLYKRHASNTCMLASMQTIEKLLKNKIETQSEL